MKTYIIILENGTIRQTEGTGLRMHTETGQLIIYGNGEVKAIAPKTALVFSASPEPEEAKNNEPRW